MDESNQPVDEEFRFEEVQKFRQPWILLAVFGAGLFTIILFAFGLYQQLVLGRPWGDRPISDTGLIASSCFMVLLMIVLMILVLKMHLVVRVQRSGIYIRYWPFIRRFIPYDRIASCDGVTYRPIREYGGWGIRGFGKKVAYNVSGDRGVQLVMTDGKHLLLGSREPDRLLQAIQMAMGR